MDTDLRIILEAVNQTRQAVGSVKQELFDLKNEASKLSGFKS